MKLLIATSNPGKFKEISEVLKHLNLDLNSLATLNISDQVEEDGSSYFENAKIKAEAAHNLTKLPTLGEDSGIVVEALANELGMHTRRWGAGPTATDQEWIDHFMKVMQAFPTPGQRKAKFISHMYFTDGQNIFDVVGETEGIITSELEADLYPGLPLSSCFKPNGLTKVYSALTEEEKNSVSHRGKAGKQMAEYLSSLLIN